MHAPRTIGKRRGRSRRKNNVYALAVGNVYSSGPPVGKRQVIQRNSRLKLTVHEKRTVIRRTAQRIENLFLKVGGRNDADIRATHRNGQLRGNVARHSDMGRGAVVSNVHGIVRNLGIIHRNAVYHSYIPAFSHYGKKSSVAISHITGLICRNGNCHWSTMYL